MIKVRWAVLVLVFFGISTAVVRGEEPPPERRGVPLGFFGTGPYSAQWLSRWPSDAVVHRTTKLSAGVKGMGIGFTPSSTQIYDQVAGLNYPPNEGWTILDMCALFVGGIRDGDTLVSTYGRGGGHLGPQHEMLVPESPLHRRGLLPDDIGLGTCARSTLVDTLTREHYPTYFDLNPNHQPLGLSIIQKSYTWDYNVFQNVLLLDYTITNVGGSHLEDVYLAFTVLPDVDRWGLSPGYFDDISGSMRDLGLVFSFDNDGNPRGGRFVFDSSSIEGFGCMAVRASSDPPDTNYNWTTYSYPFHEYSSFGPRKRGKPGDPFRTLCVETAPASVFLQHCDADRYYLMSHDEWDYDLLTLNTIGDSDAVWLPPTAEAIAEFGRGALTEHQLAYGPYDLAPDSTIRIVFALFGVDAVHTNPDIWDVLLSADYDYYYEQVRLDAIREMAATARSMAETMLSAQHSPTGLRVVDCSGDSVVLAWDPYVFPGIDGYRLRLVPVPPDHLVATGQVRPGSLPPAGGREYSVGPNARSATIAGLQPGHLYYAQAAHEVGGSRGRYSYPVVVGYGNRSMTPAPVQMKRQFAFVAPWEDQVVLNWEHDDDDRTAYYRIYRTLDSAVAANPRHAFFAIDSSLTDLEPIECGEAAGIPWCYYETAAYDSVSARQSAYVDTDVDEAAWYWVSAVGRKGHESAFSSAVRVHETSVATKDILVIYGATSSFSDFVIEDSVAAYYNRLFAGYSFDLYNWADSNCNVHADPITYRTKWEDLARYRVIIVEDLPRPSVLTKGTEQRYRTLERIVASGRDLLYFGAPPGDRGFSMGSDYRQIVYEEESFERRYLHLDSLALRPWKACYNQMGATDSLAGFTHAVPAVDYLPPLPGDCSVRRCKATFESLWANGECLPYTPAFHPGAETEVLYTYGSAYPATSELAGLPCGIRVRHPGANVYAFSFHLWGIEEEGARALIDYAVEHQEPDTAFIPHIIPGAFRLYQNYPNPFNPATTISFDLDQRGHVSLDVFNILGQEVVRLIDEERAAGAYEVQWNGRTRSGHRAASGLYLYRLRTDQGALTRKMLLLK